MSTRTEVLTALLAALDARSYDFVTPTPTVCRRAAERGLSGGAPLRAIFGWSQAFARPDLDPELMGLLEAGDLLDQTGQQLLCRVRVARVGGLLFLHSAFPTSSADAVFLGPDSYRFARFLSDKSGEKAVGSIAEIGCGAGVGGVVAARLHPGARIELGDINVAALELAAANAAYAGLVAGIRKSDGMSRLPGSYDLIVANPPYIAGASGRAYKDGGDLHGAALALEWAGQALERLTPGGRFILYTGSAILDGGTDALRLALEGMTARKGFQSTYEEIDPDIFGGELRRPAYDDVERIAAIGAVITRPG